MNEDMVKRLLNTKNRDEVIDILKENNKLLRDFSLWDERVIKHVMEMDNLTYDELKELVSPIDILI